MALAGVGAVAIWNGISAEGRANFYEWHGREHIPERVGIPGFLRGRRYVAEYGDPEFFTLYETVTPDVLTGPDYHTRLNAPTDWTLNSTAHFRDVARALCRVDRSLGCGSGGLIGTWRFELPELNDASQDRLRGVTQDLAQLDGVAGAHLLITDRSASTVDNEERKRRGSDNQVPGWILLVEGWTDCTVFSELCAGITNRHFSSYGIDVDHGLYRLQSSLTKAEMRPPTATI